MTLSAPMAAGPEGRQKPTFFTFLKPLSVDFYVLGEVVGPFLGGIIFFLFVFLMFQALRLAEFFIVHGVNAATLGKMVGLLILSFSPTVLPVAFLIAVLMGFGRLSADSELVAMKASGFGIGRLSVSVFLLSLGVCVLSLFLNLEWVPWGERTFKNTLVKIGSQKAITSIKEGTFTSGFFDLLIFADKVDTKTNRLKRVFIFDEREPKNPLTVVAQDGEIVQVNTGSEFAAAAVLKLYNGSIHSTNREENTYQKIDFGEYKLYLKVDEGGDNTIIKPGMIPFRDLVEKIKSSSDRDYLGREWRGEFWRRCSIALTPMLFVFLGMGFGTVRTRAVRAGAALVAFVVLVIYWSLLGLSTTLVLKHETFPPWLAMQIPNIVIGLIAIVSFRKAAW